jgi:cobalamin biosynthesis protein CbiG
VAAAVVRGAAIGVYQEAGNPDWWQEFGDWPASFHRLAAWPPTDEWAATLFISDRIRPEATVPTVIYRPKELVVGIGCRRGVPAHEIADSFLAMMDRAAYSPRCVAAVATVTLKGDEPGLQEFARRLGVPLLCFPPAELEGVAGVQSSSAVVRAKIGIPAVAEPAALVAAASSVLLVPKQRSARVTVALARKQES